MNLNLLVVVSSLSTEKRSREKSMVFTYLEGYFLFVCLFGFVLRIAEVIFLNQLLLKRHLSTTFAILDFFLK